MVVASWFLLSPVDLVICLLQVTLGHLSSSTRITMKYFVREAVRMQEKNKGERLGRKKTQVWNTVVKVAKKRNMTEGRKMH